jgi:hypothetical protein
MYKVQWKDAEGKFCEREFDNLAPAIEWAKTLSVFVTITGGEYDIVGHMGVAAVEGGKLPNGSDYGWYKRRRP